MIDTDEVVMLIQKFSIWEKLHVNSSIDLQNIGIYVKSENLSLPAGEHFNSKGHSVAHSN